MTYFVTSRRECAYGCSAEGIEEGCPFHDRPPVLNCSCGEPMPEGACAWCTKCPECGETVPEGGRCPACPAAEPPAPQLRIVRKDEER